MSIHVAERLKQELTDQYVEVLPDVPELRRFVGLTGMVKTINMNGRALVQFLHPVDVSWYDIDPGFLKVVEKPLQPAAKAAEPKAEKPAAAPKPVAKPAAKKPAGKSPLDMARQQGATKAGDEQPPVSAAPKKTLSPLEAARLQGAAKGGGHATAKPADVSPSAEPAAPKPTGKKLSPIEMARQQGAVKRGDEAPAAVPAAQTKPIQAAPPKPSGKKLSPLEMARMQGAAKGEGAESPAAQRRVATPAPEPADEPAAESVTESVEETATATAEPIPAPQAKQNATPKTGPGGRPLTIPELARLQGPFKG